MSSAAFPEMDSNMARFRHMQDGACTAVDDFSLLGRVCVYDSRFFRSSEKPHLNKLVGCVFIPTYLTHLPISLHKFPGRRKHMVVTCVRTVSVEEISHMPARNAGRRDIHALTLLPTNHQSLQ